MSWWTDDLLLTWLDSIGINTARVDGNALDLPVQLGPYIPPQPNRVAVATPGPGAGFLREEWFDQPGFQLFVRGDQNDLQGRSTARMARAFDQAIMFGDSFNRTFTDNNGAYLGRLNTVQRAGGGPAPMGPPDSAHRVEYVCSYVLQVATF